MRARHLAALGLVVALVVSGCASDDDQGDGASTTATTTGIAPDLSTTSTTSTTEGPLQVASDEDLYAVPDPLPEGDHGDLLRYQAIGSDVEGASAFRVLYLSESIAGDPNAVTGTVIVPTASWTGGSHRRA